MHLEISTIHQNMKFNKKFIFLRRLFLPEMPKYMRFEDKEAIIIQYNKYIYEFKPSQLYLGEK